MLNDITIVTTAVSSFNNAALLNPLFFSLALLATPLLWMVHLYGRDFVSRFGWNHQNIENQISFWNTLFLMIWILLFGGNYAVIRDSMSLLPLVQSTILFVLTCIISNNMVKLKYIEKLNHTRFKWVLLFIVLSTAVFSGIMTWWGMLLQASAVLCGMIVGCRLTKNRSWIPMLSVIFCFLTVAILMQPEFFRFGQLGNLTIIHLIMVMLTGFFAITVLTTKYTHACSKLRKSVYIKLKWLFRIIAILAAILFISTESVPVFIGLLVSAGLLEMLSIYHNSKIADSMFKQSLAFLMIVFGILIICPVISALGIVYLTFIPNKTKAIDFLHLL